MRRFRLSSMFLLFALGVSAVSAQVGAIQKKATPKTDVKVSDEEALKQAGLSPTDGNKLIAYLEQRTLTDVDQGKLKEIIRTLGADSFDERQKASEQLEQYGPAALGPLREAERDSDPEVAYRAKEAVKKLNKVKHELVAAAAVRAVLRLQPPKAARALLGFLPLAGDEKVADEIREALVSLAVQDGKTDPALIEAISDPTPVRRAAAYAALIEASAADALPKVRQAVREEADVETKFRGLWALILHAKEKDALAGLIKLTPQLSRGRIWQLEDLLLQLADTGKPAVKFGRTPEALAKARDSWLAWWESKSGKVDLAAFEYKPRTLGFTEFVEMDPRGFGNWRITSIGPDEKERWRITNVANPSDARVLPNGNVLVVEQNINQLTERDTTGKQINSKVVNLPLAVEPLVNANRLVTCRNDVFELDKDGKQIFHYTRPGGQHDVVAARRLPNGETVVITNSGTSPDNCHRLDAKGKPVGKSIPLGKVQAIYAGLDVLSNDRVLMTEFNRVVEYDLKTGKEGWSYNISNPSSVQRLPNGNTLIASTQSSKVIEVDEAKEIVWEYQAKDGLRVLRAHRR